MIHYIHTLTSRALTNVPGVDIIVSEYALEETNQRLFPASKNRSPRIRKKLIKRFGGEFRKVPAIFKTPQGIIMHPVRYREFQAVMAQRVERDIETKIYGALSHD